MKDNVAAIILAAGKGLRMKSGAPKVLHQVCNRPMIGYVFDLVKELGIKESVVVLGSKAQEIKKELRPKGKIVIQKKLIGTADAVKTALAKLKGFKGTALILYGDIPLLKKDTIRKLLKYHVQSDSDLTILTAVTDKPQGYGRVIRDRYNTISGIVEEKDTDEVEKDIKEVNTGIICFNKQKLSSVINLVRPNNRKKEYYLTDLIGIFYKKGYLVEGIRITDINEALGVNSRVELALANSIMQKRINEELMLKGVGIIDTGSTFISYDAKIGPDTVIYPFTVIEKDVKIGARCFVGPFAHLREGTRLKDDCLAGNFLEITRSTIASKTLVKHFGYIGDSRIGRSVNIGAGTVTANFDKGEKSLTVIKDGSSVGSDTVFVAPVTMGRNAVTGAGSVVLKNSKIPTGSVIAGVPAKQLKNKGKKNG
ncbi:MAG: NTP transferase domain-containing protein [Candidatus Omnitrophota bacterium]|jgi:bifunctional UDP-N-acetylglucosamine pyrophosphorylase/glucosamine-1-phosphate N-acetyltransferase